MMTLVSLITLALCLLCEAAQGPANSSSAAASSSTPSTSSSALADAASVCREVSHQISNVAGVFFPNSTEYAKNINIATSTVNRANATCVVEPRTSKDVGIILTSLRKFNKAPFGVLGGGHNYNKAFSSTNGVLISLSRFSQLNIRFTNGSNGQVAEVDLGPGLTWDVVYSKIIPQGLNVVGGRYATVGVSGLLLGGGYSWISNEKALGSDNVISYTLVSPKDSSVKNITSDSDPDLFFALKGGLNNFGIVTNFKVKGYAQKNKVWAGDIFIQPGNSDAFADALAEFSVNNTDPKAQAFGSFSYAQGTASEVVSLFYNSDQRPTVFDKLLSLPLQPASEFILRSFDNYTSSTLGAVQALDGNRVLSSTFAAPNFALPVMKAFQQQRDTLGPGLAALDPNFQGSWGVEPFLKSYWDTAVPSAFPHTKEKISFPPNLLFKWADASKDDAMHTALADTTNALISVSGVNPATQVAYPNYALLETPLKNLYGANVARLKQIRGKADPQGVMLRAGGYKIV